jgi:protein-S-isoprenylcysteine O-methyltransferase Ste14
MNWRVVGTMVILPCTVLVLIPAAILRVSRNTKLAADLAGCNQIELWAGIFLGAAGLILMLWTVSLFTKVGRGTPVPWNPPKRLVVQGPYRHVRNPMITGVLLVLLAEALIFQSWPLACWMAVFLIGNALYFPLVEERALVQRFGSEYVLYLNNVPRWIPRRKPWHIPGQGEPERSQLE